MHTTQRSFTHTKPYIPYSFTLSFSVFASICLSIYLSLSLTHTHIQQSHQVPGKLFHQNSLLLFKDFFTGKFHTLLLKVFYYTMGNVPCDQRRCYQSDNITSFTPFFRTLFSTAGLINEQGRLDNVIIWLQ
jgi:hypothetical protein